mmetsp:Transcript_14909/g.46975  ORF Transcript_14909/g.46975 Transcript_14909/m.46975 type:complete len:233 (+) Transcript_14909:917-1615(+)
MWKMQAGRSCIGLDGGHARPVHHADGSDVPDCHHCFFWQFRSCLALVARHAPGGAPARCRRLQCCCQHVPGAGGHGVGPGAAQGVAGFCHGAEHGHVQRCCPPRSQRPRAPVASDAPALPGWGLQALSVCQKSGEHEEARGLLAELQGSRFEADLITYNTVASTLSRAGQWELALRLVGEVQQGGVRQDVITYSAGVSASGKGRRWEWGIHLLASTRSICLKYHARKQFCLQ